MRKQALFILWVMLLFVVLAACSQTSPHQHSYASQWSYDETGHWHASVCGHPGVESERALHSFGDGVSNETEKYTAYACTVCGYEKRLPHQADPDNSLQIQCLEGTEGCYKIEGSTVTFTGITADSIYIISGKFTGNIVIQVDDAYQFELEMRGLDISCDYTSPISILSGDKVTLTAKKGYQNTVTDLRAADVPNNNQKSGAIYAECDLDIGGKGELNVISQYNNGIHTKDDLEIKNLTLSVRCADNALKGNDSVTIISGTISLTATAGDGIKTVNTDISGKGKQRGIVTISGGTVVIYAAQEGIDASFDIRINESVAQVDIHPYQP